MQNHTSSSLCLLSLSRPQFLMKPKTYSSSKKLFTLSKRNSIPTIRVLDYTELPSLKLSPLFPVSQVTQDLFIWLNTSYVIEKEIKLGVQGCGIRHNYCPLGFMSVAYLCPALTYSRNARIIEAAETI